MNLKFKVKSKKLVALLSIIVVALNLAVAYILFDAAYTIYEAPNLDDHAGYKILVCAALAFLGISCIADVIEMYKERKY